MAVAVGTAILGWVGAASATIVTIGGTAITTAMVVGAVAIEAVAVGLNYAAQAVRGKPSAANDNTVPGSSGKLQSGGIVPRSFMVGYGMTAGKLAYVNTWGKDGKTPNAYLSMVIALSDLPVSSLEGLIVNDVAATYGSGTPDANLGYPIPEFNDGTNDYLWVKFYDGTQTAADSHLVSTFSGDTNFPYTSTRVGTGVAYAVVTARVNQNLFSGFPTFKFILNGAKFYDPRADTSVGGDGSQRFDTPSTWAWTDNPKVIEYNILRGITYGGSWFYGLQNLDASRLPLSSWTAAMNECDLEVNTHDGGSPPATEKQYRCGGEIAVNVKPADAVAELEKSCNGRLAEIGGIYKTHCGAAGSSVFSFTDGDLLTTDQQQFDQFPSLSDLINAITASYPDPDQGWELSPAPGRYSDDLETADGDRQLVSDVQYNMVPHAEQVQRLMQSALNEARRFRKHTIPLPPNAWVLEPLDFIAWTSTRNGYSSKLFRVDLATDQASLDMVLVITEVDAADYDWTPANDYMPVTSGPLVVAHPAAQSMVGWAVEAVSVDGDDGKARPGIEVSWGTTDIDDVDGVIIQIRLASSGDVVWSGETPHSVAIFQTGSFIPPADLLGDTDYEVRGQYRPISQRDADWSSWLSVTTLDIRISASEIYDKAISRAKLDEALQQFQDFVSANAMDLLARIRKLSQLQAEGNLASSLAVAWLRETSVKNDRANADAVLALSATVDANYNANADAILAVQASTDNISGTGLFRVSVETTPTGYDSRIALSAAGSADGEASSAGIYIDAKSGSPSRIMLVADQVNILSGTDNAALSDAFVFTDGTLFVKSAVIPTITTDMLGANVVTAAKMDVGAINASDIIADNVIVTGHLEANAVSNVQANQNASTAPSISITTTGGSILINTCISITQSGGIGTIQITRGGSGIGNTIRVVAEADGGGIGSLMIVDTPSAGTYTYSVAPVTHCTINGGTITVVELKR